MNVLKATGPGDASDSIVVSFEGKWYEPLQEGKISVVFRKRGPKNITPRFIYVYVGSPHCLLLGRVSVSRYEELSVKDAARQAAKAYLTPEALTDYLKGYSAVSTFTVEKLKPSRKPLTLQQLSERFGFSPPQSFFVLSGAGKGIINEAMGYQDSTGRKK